MNSCDKESVQFSKQKQQAVIGMVLRDPEVFDEFRRLGANKRWFVDAHLAVTYEGICWFFKTYGRLPLVGELCESQYLAERFDVKRYVEKNASNFETAVNAFPKDALFKEIGDWARSQRFLEAMSACQMKYNAGELEEAFGEVAHLVDEDRQRPYAASPQLLEFGTDCLLTDPPERRWIWRHRIPRQPGSAGVFAAPGASGKTSLLTGLVVARALGNHFLGEPVEPGSTLIVSAEEGFDEYRRKLVAWRTALGTGFDAAKVHHSVRLLDLTGRDSKMVNKDRNIFSVNEPLVQELARAAQRTPGCDLIILETTSRLCPDESNEAMSAFITACETLARLTSTVVLTVAHVAKSVGRSNQADQYVSRGGSALSDNARFVLSLSRFPEEAALQRADFGVEVGEDAADDFMVLRGVKVNGCPQQKPTALQKIPTPFGMVFGGARLEDQAAVLNQIALEVKVQKLTDVVRREFTKGEHVTAGRLRLQKSKGGLASDHGIGGELDEVIEAAVAQGHLMWGPPVPKGGSTLIPTQKVVASA